MKKFFLLPLALALGTTLSQAQSFSDDFESYTVDNYLAKSNPTVWKTWANKPGTTEDVKISGAKAHSGAKSIYFSSVAGGPTDILLPFGGVFNSGKMAVEMWMFVDAGKVGYFNLQANAKAGEVWAIDLNFKENGTYDVLNTTDGVLLTGNYTQNTWHHIKLDINLSTNAWELLIDDVSKGKFSNSNLQVAGMDIYAMANSSFYVDDVSYSYTPATPMTLDAALMKIENISALSGQQVTPSVTIRNLGATNITKYDIAVSYNGATYNKQVTGVNIAPLAMHTVAMGQAFTLVQGPHDMTATVSNVNGGADEDNANDSKTYNIDPTVPAKGKMVVAEEGTGTWCGWCPRGAVFMDRMHNKYPEYFIPIAVHNNDPMAYHWYDVALGTKITGYPSVLVDRGAKMDPSAMESDILKRIIVAPKGTIATGASFDQNTNTLKVSLTTTFNQDVNGKYTLACVITEDGVKGTTSQYAQSNYYAGGAQGKMEGYESKPNPVPASQMVYDHVARMVIPHFSGAPVFPSSISSGSQFTSTFTFDLSGFNKENIHIVGMLFGPDGLTDNGSSATVAEAIGNGLQNGAEVLGITKFQGPDEAMHVYPNPAKDMIYISSDANNARLSILDLSGKEVYTEQLTEKGQHQVNLSPLTGGVYLVRLVTAQQVYSTRVVVTK